MSRITLALGIDPGATRTAFASIRLDPDGWMNLDHGAYLDNDSDAARLLLTNNHQRLGTVALESIVGYAYEAHRVQALVETARFEGRLLEFLRILGATPLVFPARTVRGEMCRSATASDAQVRAVVEGLTRGRLAMKSDARVHIYDAALTGIYAIAKSLPYGWRMPPAIEAEVHRLREEERGKRAEKKARVALGIEETTERRVPTRAQRGRRSAAASKAWTRRKGGL